MHKIVVGILMALLATAAQAGGHVGQASPDPDQYVLIHAGTLLAVPGNPPRNEMTVVVKNDRIEHIAGGYLTESNADIPAGSMIEIVDLSDRFVLPGLMDAHTHLRDEPSRGRRRTERGDRPELTASQQAVNAMIYARRNLAAGFTSMRDVGSNDESVFAVRDAINQGRMIGPRIFVSGSSVAVTGGHGDGTEILDTHDLAERLTHATCDGPAECRRVVRYLYKLGADLIKLTATGGFGSNTDLEPQLFMDELEAIIGTAHLLGLKVTAHAYSAVAVKDAIRAGVDSIEHGFLLDDEAIKMMKKQNVFLVPTISASYPPPVFNIPDPPSVKLRNEWRAFERAYEAGVKIAFGTDVGTFKHGTNGKEFEYMVKYGMTEMDAIRSATVMTAELFGISDEAGTLEPGKLADLIAVNGNPLSEISTLRNIDFVMKSGQVAKRNGEMTEAFTY